jgi:hypothetical protein
MSWIKKLFGAIGAYFKTGRAASDAQTALELATKALPLVAVAGNIVVGLTPTMVDDALWATIQAKFPALFNGTIKNPDELRLFALGVLTEMVKAKFGVDTSVARAAAQLAYLDYRAGATVPGSAATDVTPTAA